MSTLFASDWFVHRPVWLGLLMLSGVRSICKGCNAVRVPPRARVFPQVRGGFGALAVWTLYTPLPTCCRRCVSSESVQLWWAVGVAGASLLPGWAMFWFSLFMDWFSGSG